VYIAGVCSPQSEIDVQFIQNSGPAQIKLRKIHNSAQRIKNNGRSFGNCHNNDFEAISESKDRVHTEEATKIGMTSSENRIGTLS